MFKNQRMRVIPKCTMNQTHRLQFYDTIQAYRVQASPCRTCGILSVRLLAWRSWTVYSSCTRPLSKMLSSISTFANRQEKSFIIFITVNNYLWRRPSSCAPIHNPSLVYDKVHGTYQFWQIKWVYESLWNLRIIWTDSNKTIQIMLRLSPSIGQTGSTLCKSTTSI